MVQLLMTAMKSRFNFCFMLLSSIPIFLSLCVDANGSELYLPSPYQEWKENRGSNYDHFEMMGKKDDTAAVNWKIIDDEFRVSVAANATGWLSFGIAESGGMPGSDIVIFTAKDNALIDAHALAYAVPIVDKCQNWDLIYSAVDTDEGYIIFEASRKLDTGDPQDRAIGDDSDVSTPANRVIAAWGDTENYYYHGNQRATSVMRLHRSIEEESKNTPLDDYPYVDMVASNFSIPHNISTIYQGFCFNLTTMAEESNFPLDKDVHMVGARFLEDSDTIDHVHHMIVYVSREENECWGFDMVYIWGPGQDDSVLPHNAGFLFGPNGYKSFRLEIHYDNQGFVPDKYDNTGVRIFYTETLREHDAGIFQIGDPFVLLGSLNGDSATSSIPGNYGSWEFNCPGSCMRSEIARGKSITVFGEYLHMHAVGSRMISSQHRWGRKIRESIVDYYDFDVSGAYGMIQAPYEVLPGDSFKVKCFYKSKNPGETVGFGAGSNEEMCISFLWYYPYIEDSYQICSPFIGLYGEVACNALHRYKDVDECKVGRKFGKELANCDCRKNLSSALQLLMGKVNSLIGR